MNHRNPTRQDMIEGERLFLQQMKRLSQKTNHPKLDECGWLKTFELQFSDQWVNV